MPKANLPTLPASPAIPTPRPAAQSKPRLGLHEATIQAVRKARNIVTKPRPPPQPFEDPSSDEAEEAPIAEAVDPGSRSRGIASAALFRKEPTTSERPHTPQDDPKGVTDLDVAAEEVQEDVVGAEHHQFYMHTRRSLRGRRTTKGEHSGSKLHIVPAEEYFEMCDEDELFRDDDDTASMPVDKDTRKRSKIPRVDTPNNDRVEEIMDYDQMDIVETPLPRVRSKCYSWFTAHPHNLLAVTTRAR
jgi:hypothetical protein